MIGDLTAKNTKSTEIKALNPRNPGDPRLNLNLRPSVFIVVKFSGCGLALCVYLCSLWLTAFPFFVFFVSLL